MAVTIELELKFLILKKIHGLKIIKLKCRHSLGRVENQIRLVLQTEKSWVEKQTVTRGEH